MQYLTLLVVTSLDFSRSQAIECSSIEFSSLLIKILQSKSFYCCLQVETVAQFGVVFLLFALGLEFSMTKVRYSFFFQFGIAFVFSFFEFWETEESRVSNVLIFISLVSK